MLYTDFVLVDLETQEITKVQLTIREQSHYIMACINSVPTCILGIGIVKYYTVIIDGNKVGVLIKNSKTVTVGDE